ncbi:MAG: single-stranded DNA-binding protein [Bacteroidetes bacterium GWA2_31_9]|nr:MAG: single-stranded DNA-binding protein [Bacteroidetes bacterium GWA2_31_9]
MASVNKVILVGNVGKDPEVKYLEKDVAVAKFTLATSETYTNKNGEKITNTEWHNIVMWRGLAKVAESYVKKGSQIYIEGKIKTRSYQDDNNVTKYFTEIYGDNMILLGKREHSENEAPKNESSHVSEPIADSPDLSNSSDNDLPF